MRNFVAILLFSLSWNIATAQHDHATCGMTTVDQMPLVDFVEYYNKIKNDPSYHQREGILNVPIRFHLVGRTDGSGKIQPTLVLQQFERLRKEFLAVDMHLYLYENSFSQINSTSIYTSPGTASAAVRTNKDPNALNIFITQNANTSSGAGTTLGFYSPSDDYIIIRIQDVAGSTGSLTHELGHMFSLPHTFFGWEGVYGFYGWDDPLLPWQVDQFDGQVTMVTAPGNSIRVERVNDPNCEVAADRICDTPPDYNFGFGDNNCVWEETLLDANGDLIDPQENNFMCYYLGCDPYTWSQGQIDVMRANFMLDQYLGNDRSFLRSDYVATTDTVTPGYTIIEPAMGSTTEFEDLVLLDWEDAAGATAYQVEVNAVNTSNGQQSFFAQVTTESHLEVTSFNDGEFVSWAVKPFNESYGGAPVLTSNFFVGEGSVSTKDLLDVISSLTVSPNPVPSGQLLNVEFNSSVTAKGTITVIDLAGRTLSEQIINLRNGDNSFTIETAQFNSGLHLIKIETTEGTVYEKVIID